MNTDASIRVESVTVDFPIYSANTRSIKNRFIYHGTGGRVGRAGNRLTVRALDDVSLALEHGDRARINYYNARLAGLAPAHGAIRSILSLVPDDGLIIGEVMAMAQQAAPDTGFDNGPQLYRALLHAGVLHEDGALMCRCPIPSFRRHILDTLPAESGSSLDC